ncbi:MAG: hypothetical protein KatS3mg118_2251 [Paracoccaceae bacterium]|nr:MAG: hypothetical protein KatS3mg118_2251 [Paracoccaceae bacterium]
MKLLHVRAGKAMAVANPVLFLASERELTEDAWAGDIIGIPNHGQLRIGDTLTEGEALRFTGIPSLRPRAPAGGARVADPMKAKHLDKALMQFAEEGAAQGVHARWWARAISSAWSARCSSTCWQAGWNRNTAFPCASRRPSSPRALGRRARASARDLRPANRGHMAADHDGDPVYLTRLQWDIDRVARDHPELKLSATKEMQARPAGAR